MFGHVSEEMFAEQRLTHVIPGVCRPVGHKLGHMRWFWLQFGHVSVRVVVGHMVGHLFFNDGNEGGLVMPLVMW